MPVCVGKASVLQPGRHRVVVLSLMKLLTHLTLRFGIFLSLIFCSSRAGTTLSKAAVMLSNSSVATPSLVCHVARICWTRKSRAVSMYLPGRAPMCQAGGRLCSSDKVDIHHAMTLSSTFPSMLRSAMNHSTYEQSQFSGHHPTHGVFLLSVVMNEARIKVYLQLASYIEGTESSIVHCHSLQLRTSIRLNEKEAESLSLKESHLNGKLLEEAMLCNCTSSHELRPHETRDKVLEKGRNKAHECTQTAPLSEQVCQGRRWLEGRDQGEAAIFCEARCMHPCVNRISCVKQPPCQHTQPQLVLGQHAGRACSPTDFWPNGYLDVLIK